MYRVPVVLLALLLSTSCSSSEQPRIYENKSIGISITYDAGWTTVEQSQIKSAVDSVKREDIPTEGVSEVIPSIAFSIVRPSKLDGVNRNSNLMLMVVPGPAGSCAEVNTEHFAESEKQDYISSWPGARAKPEMDISISGMRTYTVSIPLADRTITQRRYIYCVRDSFVLMQATSSTPAGEAAIQNILGAVRVQDVENVSPRPL